MSAIIEAVAAEIASIKKRYKESWMPEQILWIKDEDADDLRRDNDGTPVECECDDGSLAVLTWVDSGLNPERRRWEVIYDMVIRDQEDRLWMRGYSTPATEQQDGQDTWTYDTKDRPDGRGNTWTSSKWVGFRPAKKITKVVVDYIGLKEHQ
jgi:hypothetical protein